MFVVTNMAAIYPFEAAQRGARLSKGQCDSFLALNAADGSLRYSLPIGNSDYMTGTSPALSPDGGVVYVASYSGLTALQAASGATLWVFSNFSDSRGTVATSAPSVSTNGDTVYTSFYTNSALGSFIALDARTGAVRWWFVLGQGGPSCSCPGGYATAASSSSTGDVYFSCGGGLFALHANGTLKWAKCGLQPQYTTPFSIGAGDVLYFGTADRPISTLPEVASGTVMAVDGASGAQLWAFQPTCDVNGTNNPRGCSSRLNGYAGALVQPPVVLNGSLLFAASGYLFALGSTAACPIAPPSPAAAGSSQGLSPGAVAGAVLGSLAAAGLLVAGWARCAKGAARSGGEEALLEGTFSSVAGE